MMKKILIALVVVQIFLLVNMIPANSFGLFSVKQVGIVSAQGDDLCCTETNLGGICQDVPQGYGNCKTSVIPTKCEEVAECKTGCCFDSEEGLCSMNSLKQKCNSENGEWDKNENCEIPKCNEGCCSLGGEHVEYVTEQRCKYFSSMEGVEIDFNPGLSQSECLLQGVQNLGACVIEGRCVLGVGSECITKGSVFHEGKLCSNPELNTSCERQASISCVDEKDELYWFDSCGNRENIYSSNKKASWNNGEILSKEKSCGAEKSNAESEDCGNCGYILGSRCVSSSEADGKKVKDGNFICKDMTCDDEDGKKRNNGEAWCAYDGKVGGTKDIVGSRHWRRLCIDGEVKVEPCNDFRQGICGEVKIKKKGAKKGDVKDGFVRCVVNRWRECIEVTGEIYSGKTGDLKGQKNVFKELKDPAKRAKFEKKCEDIGQCEYFEWEMKKTPIIPVCKPAFPGGLRFYEEVEKEKSDVEKDVEKPKTDAEQMCNVATNIPYVGTCVKVEMTGDCSGCISGCECGTPQWLEESNNICKSFGDCGAYVNIGKKVTKGGYTFTMGKKEDKPGKMKDEKMAEFNSYIRSLKKSVKPHLGSVEIIYKNVAGGVAGEGKGILTSASGNGLWTFIGSFGVKLYGLSESIQDIAKWVPGIGWAVYVVIEFIQIITKALGLWGEDCGVKKTYYHYTCLPWTPPKGGNDCDKCNDDPLKPCSEYRCQSLGAACKLINQESERPVCIAEKDDGKAPVISYHEIYEKYEFKETNSGVKIIAEDRKCVRENSVINFSLLTDEFAQCKVDYGESEDIEEMNDFFGGSNLYHKIHNNEYIVPSLASEFVKDVKGDIKEKTGDLKMYVRCSDSYGNFNKKEYVVEMCVRSGPDEEEPEIIFTIPANDGYVKFGSVNISAEFYLNEPAECKWGLTEGVGYLEMVNEMNCFKEIANESDGVWPCFADLPVVEGENKFYIRCQDQPWEIDYTKRNVNGEDFVYRLQNSASELVIDSINPEEVISGIEPVSVELVVETSGGAENGKSVCSYEFASGAKGDFLETFDSVHKMKFNSMLSGDNLINISCIDAAENYAETIHSLKIDIDNQAPRVVRVFKEGGNLVLFTNEEAECYYHLDKCSFDFDDEDVEEMTTALSKEHSAPWNTKQTYHIRCKDAFENSNYGCGIIVVPSTLE